MYVDSAFSQVRTDAADFFAYCITQLFKLLFTEETLTACGSHAFLPFPERQYIRISVKIAGHISYYIRVIHDDSVKLEIFLYLVCNLIFIYDFRRHVYHRFADVKVKDSCRTTLFFHGSLKIKHELQPVSGRCFFGAEAFLSRLIVYYLHSVARQIINSVYLALYIHCLIIQFYLNRLYRCTGISAKRCLKAALLYAACSYLFNNCMAHLFTDVNDTAASVLFLTSQVKKSFPVFLELDCDSFLHEGSELPVSYGHPR